MKMTYNICIEAREPIIKRGRGEGGENHIIWFNLDT
jgi:hypothetical protein